MWINNTGTRDEEQEPGEVVMFANFLLVEMTELLYTESVVKHSEWVMCV